MLINYDPLRNTDNDYRNHPWEKTAYKENMGFYTNFIDYPEKIALVLEDFIPHAEQPAISCFYNYLHWINGKDSPFETNDGALREGIIVNNDKIFKKSHMIDGRVEFFFRNHAVSSNTASITWLVRMFSLYLQVYRPDFLNGIVDIQFVARTAFKVCQTDCFVDSWKSKLSSIT
ncbi:MULTISPECIES: hypothetical protein [unclassified Arsenophonus]|uniref:hypothetical protein n=1 Tax=unclassified Arsenophonus TaxID=2627083 RepID=UPI002858073C|nr:hypothetical protein [Arsenophonus sp.]MDR5609654.1 hypothetical protein [Arsenophonus sp.]MDR5613454.1 hypothetical protein [Arsenophonus sp.]